MMDFRRDLVSDVQFGGEELSEALCWRIARGASSPVAQQGQERLQQRVVARTGTGSLGREGKKGNPINEPPSKL